MGLLDDAIREHLELKRKHGASDEEITQKEAEALGPARRGFPVQEAEPAEAPDEAEVAEPHALESEPFEPPTFEPVSEAPPIEEPPPFEVPPVEEPEPEPEPEEPEPVAEDEPTGEGSEDDEDVLEETPEFLQDAPEHDRLWFEQKPPRDFDFD
jgi:hypothetical protein